MAEALIYTLTIAGLLWVIQPVFKPAPVRVKNREDDYK